MGKFSLFKKSKGGNHYRLYFDISYKVKRLLYIFRVQKNEVLAYFPRKKIYCKT